MIQLKFRIDALGPDSWHLTWNSDAGYCWSAQIKMLTASKANARPFHIEKCGTIEWRNNPRIITTGNRACSAKLSKQNHSKLLFSIGLPSGTIWIEFITDALVVRQVICKHFYGFMPNSRQSIFNQRFFGDLFRTILIVQATLKRVSSIEQLMASSIQAQYAVFLSTIKMPMKIVPKMYKTIR